MPVTEVVLISGWIDSYAAALRNASWCPGLDVAALVESRAAVHTSGVSQTLLLADAIGSVR
jgi:hypothetical protein